MNLPSKIPFCFDLTFGANKCMNNKLMAENLFKQKIQKQVR
jgi:hypothetical protein